jgi:hypothetical protein
MQAVRTDQSRDLGCGVYRAAASLDIAYLADGGEHRVEKVCVIVARVANPKPRLVFSATLRRESERGLTIDRLPVHDLVEYNH